MLWLLKLCVRKQEKIDFSKQKILFLCITSSSKIFVKDIDQAAISFTMTIHSLIDYQLDRKSAGNKFNEDILDNYICWFSKEFGGKDEKNID